MRKNIGSVLILWASVAIVAGIAAIILYVADSSQSMALRLERQSVVQFAEGANQSLTDFVSQARSMAATLAGQNAVVESVQSGWAGRAGKRLKSYIENYTGYWGVAAFDLTGKITAGYASGGENIAEADFSDRAYVRAILDGAESYMSPSPFRAKTDPDSIVLAASHAAKDITGTLVGGVVVFPLWSSYTARNIDNVRFGESGYAFMLDSGGRMIANGIEPELVLEDLSSQAYIRDALKVKDGFVDFSHDGQDMFMAVAENPATGWLICMSASNSEMAAIASGQRNILIAMGVAVIAVLIAIIGVIVRKVVQRPIARIEEYTRSVAGGDFSAELTGKFDYELAKLADNIRTMVGELKNKLGFSQGLLDGMTISCVVADPEEKIMFVNQPVLDFLEHSGKPADYLGMAVSEFFYGEPGRQTITGRALTERQPITNVKVEVETRRGNTVFTQVDAAPMYDLDGRLIAGFALFSNLTELKAQQVKIEEQNEVIAKAAAEADTVADQVASASEELSAQIEQSSRGSEEQQQRTAEAATAMEQMNASVLEVARNASGAADMADRTREKAQQGAELMGSVVGVINEIDSRAQSLKQDMTALGSQADDIGQIMNVISDIADQTNLLALNAAIEAARAGDAGRGFAVVADEVRKLAEKTMAATNQVASSIAAIQESTRKNIETTDATTEAISESTELANRSGQALQEIVGMIENTSDQVRNIATASEEQSAASEEINRNTDEISRIAAETADGMIQSSRAVSELARLAQQLKSVIGDMQSH